MKRLKRILIAVILIIAIVYAFKLEDSCLGASSDSVKQVRSEQVISRQGDNFTFVKSPKQKPVKTKFTFTDSHGEIYSIFVNHNGKCYISKVSKKSGKEYRQYLGDSISTQICREIVWEKE